MNSPLSTPSRAGTQISARQPLLWAALAFSAGLWAGKYIWRPPSWWVIAAVVFLVSASYLLKRRRRAAFAIVLGAIFAAGALTIQTRGSSRNQSMNWFGDGEQVTVTAHVIAEGDVQPDGPGSWHQRIDVETEQVESDTQAKQSQAGIRLNILFAG